MTAPRHPHPPEDDRPLVLYDGACSFCTTQARRLERLAQGRLEVRPVQEEDARERAPGLTLDEGLRELKLVDAAGRVYGGAEAVVRALALGRPGLAPLLRAYDLPGLRPLAERVYRWVARNRSRLPGGGCEGACGLPSESPPPGRWQNPPK